MSIEPNKRLGVAGLERVREGTFDIGLQSHMQKVYNTMVVGLIITGLMAYGSSIEPIYNMIFTTPLKWVAMFGPLAFLWLGMTPARISRMSAEKVKMMFVLFASLFGVSLATLFHAYTGASLTRVFFITSGMFAGISIYGYTTKKDLSGVGSFMMMGLIGIIIAGVVNIFMQSELMHFVISVIGVVVFTGMTAWDTQRIKETYSLSHGDENNSKMAVMGALSLYLNFILLFMHLLSLFGNRS